jgi:acetyl-CoA/propionyl-CoA carboxylase, biotin carboxylase, biotin carboxyl carrier protein
VHLGERECSLQRRHQKVIEEAPSPLLDEATRARIGQAACETARSVDYRGAGTVEFIVSADAPDEFFFMEMNTRLQVEHPVTEEITGIDLVEQQLRIAAGLPLGFAQEDVRLRGHSFEARVYAEDPAAGFLPTGGRVDEVRHPSGDGVRVDSALEDGLDVSVDYDPMLAKIITWGADRDEARRRLIEALDETAVLGFTTNVEFLRRLLEVPEVARGELDTGLIARVLDDLEFTAADDRAFAEAALLLDGAHEPDAAPSGPWQRRDGWRLGPPAPRRYRLVAGGEERVVSLGGTPRHPQLLSDHDARSCRVERRADGRIAVVVAGESRTVVARVDEHGVWLARDGAVLRIDLVRAGHGPEATTDADPVLVSPMPGTVVLTRVGDGDRVEVGDPVVVVEAMKMEHVVRSAVAGTATLRVAVGEVVARGQALAVVVPDEAAEHGGDRG